MGTSEDTMHPVPQHKGDLLRAHRRLQQLYLDTAARLLTGEMMLYQDSGPASGVVAARTYAQKAEAHTQEIIKLEAGDHRRLRRFF